MNIPELPPKHYFKVSPGYVVFEYMDVEHYNAAVRLYKKRFWGDLRLTTVGIPGTNEHIHPTEEQIEEAMKTAALYADYS